VALGETVIKRKQHGWLLPSMKCSAPVFFKGDRFKVGQEGVQVIFKPGDVAKPVEMSDVRKGEITHYMIKRCHKWLIRS
jgi:hypothetical protein